MKMDSAMYVCQSEGLIFDRGEGGGGGGHGKWHVEGFAESGPRKISSCLHTGVTGCAVQE